MPIRPELFRATLLTAFSLTAHMSAAAQDLTTRCDPAPGSLGRLTKAQKQTFMHSQNTMLSGHPADAVVELRSLMAQLPQDSIEERVISERTAEAAIEAGDQASAISLLKPIEEHDGNDCLAITLLARANAENGQAAERDAEINALTALHKRDPKSPAGKLDVFLIEQHTVKGGGVAKIWYVLRPFGPHHTYIYSEIFDASGGMTIRVELDSDDPDQVYFKQIHPDLAAKGDRRYSLDVFVSNKLLPDPKADHHALIQFFDGAPIYDIVRDHILAIAERAAKPA